MKGTLNLKKYDLVLTYTWSVTNDQGICGHTFEVIEYFWTLKDHFNVCILMAEKLTKEEFLIAIKSKYDFSEEELNLILKHTIFHRKPKIVLCNYILFTDGATNKLKNMTLLYKKLFLFACGYLPIKNNEDPKVYVLQDQRIYENAKVNSINYVKKILFRRFKKIGNQKNRTLIYATKNCKHLEEQYYKDLLEKYPEDLLILTNENNKVPFKHNRITQMKLPVPDVFEQFNKYVYTPTERKFDCSSRFIAECKHYGIPFEFNIDYTDIALDTRIHDMNNLKNISLEIDDDIINIFKSLME